jgi:A/G-specific adenine glycosylase
MLQQTQVARVAAVYDTFLARFPTPAVTAADGPGAVIHAWGRLGYPRRARRLWEAATVIDAHGWPDDLTDLPGVGRYTARAVRAQADDADLVAVEVNVRRVLQRVEGRRLSDGEAEAVAPRASGRLRGRDRLLALMDVGALLCRPRKPSCAACPLRRRCATRGPLDEEAGSRQPAFAGSFRQRRGVVLAALRDAPGPVPVRHLDPEALASLVDDGLATVHHGCAQLPSR